MDFLISSFVNKIINDLNDEELIKLEEFVNLDDQELLKLNKNFDKNYNVNPEKIFKEFYNFKST